MLVADLRKDFYQQLLNQRVLLLVNCDVDAICACAILQELFRGDHVLYTVVPIKRPDELRQAFVDNASLLRHVILLNCGALVDLVDEVCPPDDVIVYVIDTNRPVDVNNVYNDNQIRVVSPLDAEDDVPAFSQLYRGESDSSDGDSDADGDSTEPGKRRRRYDASSLQRRDERRRWQEQRARLLADYAQFTRHTGCSALLMYQLAVQMSRDTARLLWLGLVALSGQLVARRCSRQQYVLEAGRQQGQVARFSHRADHTTSVDCLRLSFEPDLNLALYRHWCLYDSLRYTPHVACRLRLFTYRGEKRLLEMLAELGLPLSQCRQRYSTMDMDLRGQLRALIESRADKYGLEQAVQGSFLAQRGYRQLTSAADVAHAVLALLENATDNSGADNFLQALACLDRRQEALLSRGFTQAQKLCQLLYETVRSMLDMHHVISIGAFLYATVSEGEPNVHLLARPLCLGLLAQFTLDAHVASERSRRCRHLPLVLSAPLDQQRGSCLLVGVPPVSEHAPRNLLGRAFQRAAERSGVTVRAHTGDGAVVEMLTDERSKFLDTLVALLA